MKILSLQIGKSKEYKNDSKQFQSSFSKDVLLEKDFLGFLGFSQDTQTDKRYHGGEEKAVMAFSVESKKAFEKEFQKEFSFGSFGENITFEGIDENSVKIGDIFQFPNATLQVTQPREPCWKVSFFLKDKNAQKFMYKSGLTGWYFKVIQKGEISVNDRIKVISSPNKELTIANLNRLVNKTLLNSELLQEAINCESLGKAFRKTLLKRI